MYLIDGSNTFDGFVKSPSCILNGQIGLPHPPHHQLRLEGPLLKLGCRNLFEYDGQELAPDCEDKLLYDLQYKLRKNTISYSMDVK